MVTVTDYAVRENGLGEEFIALILTGDLEMVRSQETGQYYATSKRCSVTSTFTKEVAQSMIGKQISGKIVRRECEPYEYTIPETGEVIQLSHHWEYSADDPTVDQTPAKVSPPVSAPAFSWNGEEALV